MIALCILVCWLKPVWFVWLFTGYGAWRFLRWGLWLDEPPPCEAIDWKAREGWQ